MMDTVERVFFVAIFGLFAVDVLKNWITEALANRDERRRREDFVDEMMSEDE